METKQMRSFAAGLIVAGFVCGAAYFLGNNVEQSQDTVNKPNVEEMKSMLMEEGFLIYTEDEFQTQLAAVQDVAKKAPKTETTTEVVAQQTVLNVTLGMTSFDVGKVLVSLKITDTAMGFVNEVEKRGVANKLRPGTYNITSNMTVDEVIAMVFK